MRSPFSARPSDRAVALRVEPAGGLAGSAASIGSRGPAEGARAYYNEVNPHAVLWLRNLIGAGLITAGDVDDRSIVDVRAADLRGYTRHHFFAGIGIWDYALGLAGWPADRPVWTGSCPCQPVSKAGRGLGSADDRHLWPAWFGLIAEFRPDVVLGEQVAEGTGREWLDAVQDDLEHLDYACGAVVAPAAGFGAEHIRDRLWFVAHASGAGSPRPFPHGYGAPGLGAAEELQRGHAGLSARVHPRSDRAAVRQIDGSARWVDAVHACGNGIDAYAAAAFIEVARDLTAEASAGEARQGQDAQRPDPQDDHATGASRGRPSPSPDPVPDRSLRQRGRR